MTEKDIKRIGFEFVKEYEHDEWFTRRYKKGVIEAEFTYRSKNAILETFDITIDEVVGQKVDFAELQVLDKVLNKKQ